MALIPPGQPTGQWVKYPSCAWMKTTNNIQQNQNMLLSYSKGLPHFTCPNPNHRIVFFRLSFKLGSANHVGLLRIMEGGCKPGFLLKSMWAFKKLGKPWETCERPNMLTPLQIPPLTPVKLLTTCYNEMLPWNLQPPETHLFKSTLFNVAQPTTL